LKVTTTIKTTTFVSERTALWKTLLVKDMGQWKAKRVELEIEGSGKRIDLNE
jgi:hypothetical protein